jgi:O-antigen/teichoic acid export membrane protein
MPEAHHSRALLVRLLELIRTSHWGELVLRTGTVLIVRVAGTGLGFVFNVALARVLGADGLGVYHLSLTFALIASVVGRVGMDATLLKFGATSYAASDGERLLTVHRMGVGTAALGCSIVAVGSFLGADWLAVTIFADPSIAGPLRLTSLGLVPFALLNLYGELLKAGQHQAMSSLIQGAALPAVSLLLLLVFAREIVDAGAAATIYLAANVLVCLASYWLWRRSVPRGPPTTAEPVSYRLLLTTAIPVYGSAIADVVMTFADVLILGMFVTTAEVGVYTAAARTALLTRFLLLATGAVAAPRFAALHAAGDHAGLAKLAVRSTMLTTASTLPLLLLFIVFPEALLSMFGPQFAAGAQVLIILTLGQFVNAATGPCGYLLNMCGHHRVEGRIAVAGAFITVVLCFLLIPFWGMVGAAAANAIATGVCNLWRVYVARAKLGIIMLPIPATKGGINR